MTVCYPAAMFRAKLRWMLATAMCWLHALAIAGAQPPISEPVRIGGDIKPPAQVKHVPATYPEIARAAKVQGVVIIDVTIGPTGKVVAARVIESIPLLDRDALEAVRAWEFVPTIVGGVAVPVIMTVMVRFSVTEGLPQIAPWSIAGGLSASALHALVATKNRPFTGDLSIVLEGSDDEMFTGRLARDGMGRTRIDLASARPRSDTAGRRATWILDPGRSVIHALAGDRRDPVEHLLARPHPFSDSGAGPDCERLVHGAMAATRHAPGHANAQRSDTQRMSDDSPVRPHPRADRRAMVLDGTARVRPGTHDHRDEAL